MQQALENRIGGGGRAARTPYNHQQKGSAPTQKTTTAGTASSSSSAAARPFVAAPNSIFSDSLRRALSPAQPQPQTQTHTHTHTHLQQQQQQQRNHKHHHHSMPAASTTGFAYTAALSGLADDDYDDGGHEELSLSASASGEEIWRPSPTDSPPTAGSRQFAPGDGTVEEIGGLLGGIGGKLAAMGKSTPSKTKMGFVGDDDDDEYYGSGDDGLLGSRKANKRSCLSKVGRKVLVIALGLVMLVVVVSISVGVSLAPPDSDASSDNSSYDPTVILVSIDGFRNDYLSRGLTPNIADLADAGVQADYLRPAFPSVTFPNHYTLVTGLWPADHGIVANTFFDSELNDTFVYVDPKSNVQSKWWGGEPIWVTAVKQGQRSATCMWPGSEAPITKDHVRPTYWLAYDHNLPLTDRVGHIFKWLDLPRKDRPTLLTLYAADVDSAGHTFGPDSLEVNASLARVDAMVGMLIDGIRKRNLASSVNLVVVSDHGMATVKDFIFLDDYVDISKVRLWNSLLVGIEPVDSKDKDEILRNLTIASNATGLFKVWEKANVPARFHYSHGPRIASIQLLPELGITATTRQLHDAAAPPKGMHGYDNTLPEMQAIFIAAGPKFAPSRWSVFGSGLMHTLGGQNQSSSTFGDTALGAPPLSPSSSGSDPSSTSPVGTASTAESMSYPPRLSQEHAPASSSTSESGGGGVGRLQQRDSAAARESIRRIPGFDNVQVYNLLAKILGLSPAPNNGTHASGRLGLPAGGGDPFLDWLAGVAAA